MKTLSSIILIVLLAGAGVFAFMLVHNAPDKGDVPSDSDARDDAAPRYRIVAFGDSLTAGYGLPLREAYPALLEKRLQREGWSVEVINSGVSGETSAGNRARASFVRSLEPDIVILGIGGNDMLRLLPVTELQENMRATLRELTAGEDAPGVILLEIKAPLNVGLQYKRSFEATYSELAEEFSIELVPFIVKEVARNPELLQSDGIHPTSAGYDVLVDSYIVPATIRALEEMAGE